MFKRVGVVYCFICGCETSEVDGVCDDCLDGLSAVAMRGRLRQVDQELKIVVPLERELAVEDR